MSRAAWILAALSIACASCSDEPGAEDAGLNSCATNAAPTFTLGTGDDRFIGELTPEQTLQMERGPQGGCHLPLAFRTDGFAQRRFTVKYKLTFADSGDEIITSRETRNLQPRADQPGLCELLAFRAFLIEPWDVEEKRVRIEIDVEDDLGKTASTEVIVRPKWPDEVGGVLRRDLCGPRPQPDAEVTD